MKTIVISGARSNVGKTTLAEAVSAVLPGSVYVKLGHGEVKEDIDNIFYHAGTPYERIEEENPQADFLIIESNRILEEMDPDLAIYLPAEDPKPSAALAEASADLIRGRLCRDEMVRLVAGKLEVDDGTAAEIVRLACGTWDGAEDEK
jgi:hypothetical protein